MDGPPIPHPATVERIVEHERSLVLAAIELVASGRSPRVTVASLRFGDRLVRDAEDSASEAGVGVQLLPSSGPSIWAITVEASAID